jgi:hypothetical protein
MSDCQVQYLEDQIKKLDAELLEAKKLILLFSDLVRTAAAHDFDHGSLGMLVVIAEALHVKEPKQ